MTVVLTVGELLAAFRPVAEQMLRPDDFRRAEFWVWTDWSERLRRVVETEVADEGMAVAKGEPYDMRQFRHVPEHGDVKLVEGPFFRFDRVDGLPDKATAERYHGALLVLPRQGTACVEDKPVEPGQCALAHSLELEIGAIQHVYQLAQSPVFARVAERIANADAVYILGIQSTRGISNAFYSYLEYIRARVFYSDGMSGSYVDSLNSEFASPYLVITDTRAYSMIARRYCEAATRRGVPFALVTFTVVMAAGQLVNTLTGVTGGFDGLNDVPRLHVGAGALTPDSQRLVTASLVALVLLVLSRLSHSPFGGLLTMIRDVPRRAAALGYHVPLVRIAVFTAPMPATVRS